MAIVTKTFTYKIPDDYTLQTNDNDSSGTYTYRGPRYWEMTVSKDNRITAMASLDLEDGDINEFIRLSGDIKVVDALVEPILVSCYHQHGDSDDTIDGNLGYRTKTLPDGLTYSNPHPVPPWKAYEVEDLKWDPVANTLATPLPWHKPWTTWTDVTRQAQSWIGTANTRIAELEAIENPTDEDSDKLVEWKAYKEEAANKISSYAAADLLPHEVVFSQDPDFVESENPEPDSDA